MINGSQEHGFDILALPNSTINQSTNQPIKNFGLAGVFGQSKLPLLKKMFQKQAIPMETAQGPTTLFQPTPTSFLEEDIV